MGIRGVMGIRCHFVDIDALSLRLPLSLQILRQPARPTSAAAAQMPPPPPRRSADPVQWRRVPLSQLRPPLLIGSERAATRRWLRAGSHDFRGGGATLTVSVPDSLNLGSSRRIWCAVLAGKVRLFRWMPAQVKTNFVRCFVVI